MDKKEDWAVEVRINGDIVVGLYSDDNARVLADPEVLKKAAGLAVEFAAYAVEVGTPKELLK